MVQNKISSTSQIAAFDTSMQPARLDRSKISGGKQAYLNGGKNLATQMANYNNNEEVTS